MQMSTHTHQSRLARGHSSLFEFFEIFTDTEIESHLEREREREKGEGKKKENNLKLLQLKIEVVKFFITFPLFTYVAFFPGGLFAASGGCLPCGAWRGIAGLGTIAGEAETAAGGLAALLGVSAAPPGFGEASIMPRGTRALIPGGGAFTFVGPTVGGL